MITYSIDKEAADKVNDHLTDIQVVLDEITPSLQILRRLLSDHEKAVNSPALETYRNSLVDTLTQAIGLSFTVAQQTKALTRGSKQATKHLGALDSHIKNTIQNPVAETADKKEKVFSR